MSARTLPCDTARAYLSQQSVKYTTTYGAPGSGVKVVVNGKDVPYTAAAASNPQVLAAVQAAGYPKAGDAQIVKMSNPFDIFRPQVAAIVGLLFVLVEVHVVDLHPMHRPGRLVHEVLGVLELEVP